MSAVQWGDVATWGTTAGTVGLAFFTWRVVQGDQSDRRAREADARNRAQEARRDQASAVVQWFDVYGDQDLTVGAVPGNHARPRRPSAIVRNASGAPIWDVDITFVNPDTGQPLEPPTRLSVVPPNEARALPQPDSLSTWEYPSVVIVFRDAAGVIWRRDHNGKLMELTSKQ